ncbi:MAG TPA: hypothetical protein VF062_01630 [Candidatus Limnocylindrales bacterium]
MERVSVTDSGVEVHSRSSVEWISLMPWPEIAEISLDVIELPPHGVRRLSLEIDLTYGEFVSVGQDAEGFAEAVAEIAARSGRPGPDLSTLDAEATLQLWPVG